MSAVSVSAYWAQRSDFNKPLSLVSLAEHTSVFTSKPSWFYEDQPPFPPLLPPCLWGKAQLVWALQVCADTLIGNDMIRGVSGGQRKRVTTGMLAIRSAAKSLSCL